MPKTSARSPSLTSQESYSAVIIADMVAEVPIHPESEISQRRSSAMKSKEETNFGYDGQMDTEFMSPATVKLDAMVTVNLKPDRTNGGGISKGVILNTAQFTPTDSKLKTNQRIENQIPLSLPTQASDAAKTSPTPSGFSDMSISRKIAFGFSFLPSILFVLCFAVLLPCENYTGPQPSVQEKWSITLNDTDVTSKLRVSNNILFTFAKDYESGVISIDKSSGEQLWETNINSSARYIQCGKLDTLEQETCIVMDGKGSLKLLNPSNGSVLWSRDIQEEETPSLPLILPDCNKDNLEEVAVAVSKSKIKILFGGGSAVSSVPISGCDAIPVKLTAWNTTDNTTDLLFVCQRKEKEILVRVPESKWCIYSSKPKSETSTLTSRDSGVLTSSVFLPTEEGLVLWTESEVSFLETNGTLRWQVSSGPHSSQNRFALLGKFDGKENQVALFSSDFNTGFQVTTLNYANGSSVSTYYIPNAEVLDVALLSHKGKDMILVLMNKMTKDLTAEAFARINEVSTTIINYIVHEETNSQDVNLTSVVLKEEIALIEVDKNCSYSIQEKELPYLNGTSYESRLTALLEEKNEKLSIFIQRKSESFSKKICTHLRSLTVDNWYMPPKSLLCSWK